MANGRVRKVFRGWREEEVVYGGDPRNQAKGEQEATRKGGFPRQKLIDYLLSRRKDTLSIR